MRFLLLLIVKDRESLLPEIVREFQKLRNERLGILDTTVHTAIQFTQREDEQLIQHLQQRTGKKVRIRYIVDASLKGGFIVQHDDTVWNGSVRHQLERLRLQFAVGTV
jgi:F-type H+-transporting ATPase subunit delta